LKLLQDHKIYQQTANLVPGIHHTNKSIPKKKQPIPSRLFGGKKKIKHFFWWVRKVFLGNESQVAWMKSAFENFAPEEFCFVDLRSRFLR